jgi:hypothetical protein
MYRYPSLPIRGEGGGPCFIGKKLRYAEFARRVPVPIQGIPCKVRLPGPVFGSSVSSPIQERLCEVNSERDFERTDHIDNHDDHYRSS